MKERIEFNIFNPYGLLKMADMILDFDECDFIFTGLNKGLVLKILDENGFLKHYNVDYMTQKDLSKKNILKYKIILNSKYQSENKNIIWLTIKSKGNEI